MRSFLPYTFPRSTGALALQISEAELAAAGAPIYQVAGERAERRPTATAGMARRRAARAGSGLAGVSLEGASLAYGGAARVSPARPAMLETISAPAVAPRARRPRPPALHTTFVPGWSGSGERLEVNAKARPPRPRRLGHGAAAFTAPCPAAPDALPPLRSDMDAPRDSSMPPAAPDPCRPAIAPLTISIRPVEPAAKVAARQTRATMPRMPLVAAGFTHAGARPCVPRFLRPAQAAVSAPGVQPVFAARTSRPALTATLSVSQVGGPSSLALEAAPRATGGRREAAALTFGCRIPATEARCVPALLSPAPERCALSPSSRYIEFTPEASMWKPEPAPKTGVLPVPSPREEGVSLRVAAPRMAGPVREGVRMQQIQAEPFTFPCMCPAPVEAVIEDFTLEAALKPFEKEFKAYATRRHRFQVSDVWRYTKPAAAAALVVASMALGSLAAVRRTPAAIEHRATVEWNESFRSGLKLWRGASSWTVDAAGYARPAQLAVFVPSRELSNYRLHFLTQIESKGVAWAFRVHDPRNYYGAELRVSKPGPRPMLELVRYTVTAGRRQDEVRLPLNIMAHNSLPFQVTLEALGDSFRLEVEGETVDEWSDGRFPAGGIGFFSDSGSRARIYWVQLASHPDWLGRLCALFTANNRPVTAQVQPAEAHDHGNDGEFRLRRVGTGRSRTQVHR